MHYSDILEALSQLKAIVSEQRGLVSDCRPLVLGVADAAAEQAEARIG